MTCEDFKSKALLDPRELTRAERSATHNHLIVCSDCEDWFGEMSSRMSKTLNKADAAEIYLLYQEDAKDPEIQ